LNKEKAKKNLETILEKMHSVTDISVLHEYHKLYKKEISFFKRSWAAAWLFMYYDSKETPNMSDISKGKPKGKTGVVPSGRKAALGAASMSAPASNSNFEEKPAVEIILSEDESKRLFISIGKNRRLFPREVITLIMSKTSTPREDIGMIRILDNYSFVQVRDTKADEIIQSLTGHRFRGRTLSVNYAKPKSAESERDNLEENQD
jgi:hypothetical protein